MLWCGESCLSSFWSLCGLYVRRLLWCALCGRRMTVTYAWTHPRYKSASCIIVQRERVRVPGRFFTGEWSESRESVVLPCYG